MGAWPSIYLSAWRTASPFYLQQFQIYAANRYCWHHLPAALTFASMHPHTHYMHRCIQLARLGAGYTAPNPMVGAVLVHEHTIIGEGWHQQYGGPHAEVHCFETVPAHLRHLIPQSTLYVSLEPCNHFGKTPPCSLRILQEGVSHVVVGCTDPFEAVNGTGIARLRSAGVQVEVGVLTAECRALNQAFFTYHEKKRPWVTLKWAQTADGYLDDTAPEPLAISSAPARRWVHKLRSSRAAIMAGTHTVLADNPLLDNRLWWGKPPLRVITDRSGQVPPQHRIFQNPDGLIVFSNAAADFFPKGCKVLPVPVPNNERVAYYLQQLYSLQVQSVLVEGGAALLHSFLAEGLWDETIILRSRHVNAGAGLPAPPTPAVAGRILGRLGSDTIDIYHNTL